MLRSFTTACALGALLVAGPALAQTQDQPATAKETMQAMPAAPGAQPGSAPRAQGSRPTEPMAVETVKMDVSAPEMQGGFIARQGENHLLASELMDAGVMTSADESLGKVEDMLVDAQGRVLGIVVGVGGFLGMGEKRVAIPLESIEVVYDEGEARETADAGTRQPRTGEGLALTGGTDIAHILVDFSRDELEQAPEFARFDEQDREMQAEVDPVRPVDATGATAPAAPMPAPASETPRAQ